MTLVLRNIQTPIPNPLNADILPSYVTSTGSFGLIHPFNQLSVEIKNCPYVSSSPVDKLANKDIQRGWRRS
ncbi:MAG: hypothetical protein F6K31_29275 [Symploca sp. SIO2G7]|nr:hypothetical protein [Symploca sp. SIO2G7]